MRYQNGAPKKLYVVVSQITGQRYHYEYRKTALEAKRNVQNAVIVTYIQEVKK